MCVLIVKTICYNINMEIKKKTHYTIKVLIHLNLLQKNNSKLVDIRKLASALDIPYEHVRKIVQDLVKLQLVESTRGRNGGVQLAKKDSEIHLYDLILAIEEVSIDDFKHDCSNCSMPPDCKFKSMLKNEYKRFYESFKDIYLSNIM